jgi:uncharacterized membrane protein YhaH (DUF805 family)
MYYLRHFADFSGRARRKEYWLFFLFNYIFYIVVSVILVLICSEVQLYSTMNFLLVLTALGAIIPYLAATVRRLHDIGKSPHLLIVLGVVVAVGILIYDSFFIKTEERLISALIIAKTMDFIGILTICMLIFLCKDSQQGENKYGKNPKEQIK